MWVCGATGRVTIAVTTASTIGRVPFIRAAVITISCGKENKIILLLHHGCSNSISAESPVSRESSCSLNLHYKPQ